jgi:hypothetical protein
MKRSREKWETPLLFWHEVHDRDLQVRSKISKYIQRYTNMHTHKVNCAYHPERHRYLLAAYKCTHAAMERPGLLFSFAISPT